MGIQDQRNPLGKAPIEILTSPSGLGRGADMTTYADDELLTIDEATEYLGVTKRRCYQRRWQQIGPVSHKRNNRIVYWRSDIDKWLRDEERRTQRGQAS
jgi:hypothetical protein